MKKYNLTLSTLAVAVSLALAACGGSGGGTSLAGDTTTTRGVITGFGSVFVNGVEYDIPNGISISMDGDDATESDLQVGMLVTLTGTVNADGKTGTATLIKYSDQMEGVVSANTVTAGGTGTLTVMGQSVDVTADTVFESKVAGITSPDLIQVGNVVEVSGYASSTGTVTATRIEVKAAAQAAGAVVELKGIVANLDTINKTFTLGSLTVDYNTAMLPDSALADGQYVEVKSTTTYNGTGPLIASKVELEDDGFLGHDGHEGEGLEIKGLVTADFTNGQFELNGRTILVDNSTRIENGTTSQLLTGTPVKVHTHYDADGKLIADKIDFKNASKIKFEGTLEAVDLAAGTITILGQVIYVDNNTVILDKSENAARYFSLADLNPADGDHLELKAYLDSATGHLIATKLERKNYSAEVEIEGSVDTSDGLKVAGISVDTSTATGIVPALHDGDIVEVKGTYSNGVLYVDEVSLED